MLTSRSVRCSACRPTRHPPRSPSPPRSPARVLPLGAVGPSRRVEGFLAQVLQRRGNHDTFRLLRVSPPRSGPTWPRASASTRSPRSWSWTARACAGRLAAPRGCEADRVVPRTLAALSAASARCPWGCARVGSSACARTGSSATRRSSASSTSASGRSRTTLTAARRGGGRRASASTSASAGSTTAPTKIRLTREEYERVPREPAPASRSSRATRSTTSSASSRTNDRFAIVEKLEGERELVLSDPRS